MSTHLRYKVALTVATLLLPVIAAAQTFRGGRTDFRDETIYFVMTTRFYDGDPQNNTQCWDNREANAGDPAWRGDFKGLIEKLDYIKALGFTAIWITPVVQNASGYDYHGYHAMDFSRVDHRYESKDVSLQTLIDAVHERGMKIVIDIVLNHTGNYGEEHLCKLFNRDWSQPQSRMSACMVPLTEKDGGLLPDNYANLSGGEQYDARLRQMKDHHNTGLYDRNNHWHHFGNFNWDNETRWWAQIAGDCVDLNTENPEVSQYLVDCYTSFINMGADGFRIDTGGHIARLTLNNLYLPQLQQASEAPQAVAARSSSGDATAAPFFMFAEVCSRYTSWWYRQQPALSCPFYTWKEQQAYPWDYDAASWQGLRILANESTDFAHVNMQSCEQHYRDNREGSESRQPTSDNAFLRGNDYHAPNYAQYSGLSVIDFPMHHCFKDIGSAWAIRKGDQYYNDATMNVVYVDSHDYAPNGAPESQRFAQPQAVWAENLDLMFTFRGIPCLFYGSETDFRKGKEIDTGTRLPLRDTGRAYYGGYLKGDVTTTDFGQYTQATGNLAQTLSHPLAQHIRRLNMIRAAVPALRRGQYSTDGCQGAYAFKRRYTDDRTDSYALITINGNATFTGILNGTYTDCVTGDVVSVSDGRLTATCNGRGNMRVYVLSTNKTPAPGKIGDDGLYLYDTTPATVTQPQWDGTEEEDSENNGDTTGGTDTSLDELAVYTPTLDSNDELSVFLETAQRGATIWVWNSHENFTGGSWGSKPAMTVMGKTADGQRRILKWTYDGSAYSDMPTGLIFVPTGQNQTADLIYVNHGYYVEGRYDHTVSDLSGIVPYPSVTSNPSSVYDLWGRKVNNPQQLRRGIYIKQGRKEGKR